MSDRKQQIGSWTPGPWCVYGREVWSGTNPEVEGSQIIIVKRKPSGGMMSGFAQMARDKAVPVNPSDAELIALAPEMAAAILAWARTSHDVPMDEYRTEADHALDLLVDKLRAIGGYT